jgi:hypothetical protein
MLTVQEIEEEIIKHGGLIRSAPSGDMATHNFIQLLSGWTRTFLREPPGHFVDLPADGPVDVGRLRAAMLGRRPPKTPMLITATGTFFPCLLLCSGWWERRASVRPSTPVWKPGTLQEWLYVGFEQWAPSWDVSSSMEPQAEQQLIAQLGAGDEAESVAVILSGEHRSVLHQHLLDEGMVFPAEVTGQLCHRKDLPRDELAGLGEFGRAFDYCIRLEAGNNQHRITRRTVTPTVYSGYLWQCLVPKRPPGRLDLPRLDETFFVWEHTNFLNKDALAYNLDSLRHKIQYLESIYGGLQLVQRSSQLVDFGGEPLLPTTAFYKWLLSQDTSGKVDQPVSDGVSVYDRRAVQE